MNELTGVLALAAMGVGSLHTLAPDHWVPFAALARARSGHYRERSFRALPPSLRDRYFTPEADGWRVSPALHARVTSWSVANLLCDGDVAPRAPRAPMVRGALDVDLGRDVGERELQVSPLPAQRS